MSNHPLQEYSHTWFWCVVSAWKAGLNWGLCNPLDTCNGTWDWKTETERSEVKFFVRLWKHVTGLGSFLSDYRNMQRDLGLKNWNWAQWSEVFCHTMKTCNGTWDWKTETEHSKVKLFVRLWKHWWASSSDMLIYPSIFAFPSLSLHRRSTPMHLRSDTTALALARNRTCSLGPISLIWWTYDLRFTCIYFYS